MTPPADTPRRSSAGERAERVRAVLFDLDGTLIDTGALILASFRHATAAVFGEALPDEIVMRGVGIPLRLQMTEFAPERADELLAAYRAHNAAHHDALAREFPGTTATLDRLKERGLPLAVVTSKSTTMAERGLRHFGLREYFETVVSADDVTVYKPDPFPLRVAAGRLSVPLEECAYVGDSPHDMQAAVEGGAVSIAALWGVFEREEVLAPRPDFALDSISDLVPLLNGESERYLPASSEGDPV